MKVKFQNLDKEKIELDISTIELESSDGKYLGSLGLMNGGYVYIPTAGTAFKMENGNEETTLRLVLKRANRNETF